MKVVILCGGEGTRMKEETEFKPKPLVEIGGKPVLWHIMKIYAHYGFNEFILTLGYKGNMIKDYFLNWRSHTNDFTLDTRNHTITYHNNGHEDFKITFVDTGLKSLTGERVRRIKDYITDDQFMLTYGDSVADIDIFALVEFHRRQRTIGTITGAQPLTKYGIVKHDEQTNMVKDFSQNLIGDFKEDAHKHDFLINGGFMVFQRSFIDMIEPDSMVEEIFPRLSALGQLSLYRHPGKWKAMDTYKEVEEMNTYWQKNPFWKIWDEAPQGSSGNIASIPAAAVPLVPTITPFSTPSLVTSYAPLPNYLVGKNVLVTGATGLVGSHLTEQLVKVGARVFALYRSLNPKSYFMEQKLQEKVTLVQGDLTDAVRMFDLVSKYEIEYIYHLAAQPIVATSFINPYETFNSNIMGTVNILEAARRSPYIKGVIVASSDKAYGKDCVDVKEDQKLDGDHPYDVSKSCADLIARTYYNTYKLPVVVSRFGNIFGPGDLNLNRIIPGIMQSIFRGDTLPIRSDGKFVRDYVYVKDVVSGYLLLPEKMDVVQGQAFNFSTGYNFSVLDLIRNISAITGAECKYEIHNNQVNEIPFQSLNYEKAIKVLGWQPAYTLEQGVRETYEWYKNFNYH